MWNNSIIKKTRSIDIFFKIGKKKKSINTGKSFDQSIKLKQ